jgi:hypothetical protein
VVTELVLVLLAKALGPEAKRKPEVSVVMVQPEAAGTFTELQQANFLMLDQIVHTDSEMELCSSVAEAQPADLAGPSASSQASRQAKMWAAGCRSTRLAGQTADQGPNRSTVKILVKKTYRNWLAWECLVSHRLLLWSTLVWLLPLRVLLA